MLLCPGLALQLGCHSWGHRGRSSHEVEGKQHGNQLAFLRPVPERTGFGHIPGSPPNFRPIGSRAISCATRLILGPQDAPNRPAGCLDPGFSRPQSRAVRTGAAPALGSLGKGWALKRQVEA